MTFINYTEMHDLPPHLAFAVGAVREYFDGCEGDVEMIEIPCADHTISLCLQSGSAAIVVDEDDNTKVLTGCKLIEGEWWFECVNPGPPFDAHIAWLPYTTVVPSRLSMCYAARPKLV